MNESAPVQERTFFVYTIRYGKMLVSDRFKTDRAELVKKRDKCVVRTERGREFGTVLTEPEPLPAGIPPETLPDILRKATADDINNERRIESEMRVKAMQTCKDEVKKLSMPMKVVECDYLMGGERIIFYFICESRIDFRELVRRLARDLHTRIELKQVGARDEARLVGDCGHCGLTLCCRSHLKELGGITMDMAKVQKHTADPTKITGRCGKLLCCLRYEYTAYAEARDMMPNRGIRIVTKRVNGVIVDQNLLLREVTVIREGTEERVVVKLEEIEGMPKAVAGCDGCASPKATGGTGPAPEEAHLEDRPAAEAAPAAWLKVARVGDIAEGKGKAIDVGGRGVALFLQFGQYQAIQNECPHRGGPLGEGVLNGTVVTCPLHSWKFDITTGAWLSDPTRSLKRFEVKVEGEDILVKM